MKRNLKGKLILSIATLGLACVSTIGSTYAWFIVNSDAKATGVEMKANSGTGLYIRNGHSGAFADNATIKSLDDAKWEPVTGYTTTGITAGSAFTGAFGTFSGISADKTTLTYTALTNNQKTQLNSTDVYGTATTNGTDGSGTTTYTAYYYAIEMDYMITSNKKLNIAATDVIVDDSSATVKKGTASIAQAARVAFFPATTWSDTGSHTYSTSGVQEYCLTSSTTDTDFNLEQLKALGYTGENGDYKLTTRNDLTSTAYTNSTHTSKKTSDGSFTYGSVKIFVWFDGTDYACSNALFDQKLTFNFKFTVTDAD